MKDELVLVETQSIALKKTEDVSFISIFCTVESDILMLLNHTFIRELRELQTWWLQLWCLRGILEKSIALNFIQKDDTWLLLDTIDKFVSTDHIIVLICKYNINKKLSIKLVIWNVYGECENIGTMTGHTGAIMELHFSTDGNDIFTCSTDCSLGMWDLETGKRVKKFKGECF